MRKHIVMLTPLILPGIAAFHVAKTENATVLPDGNQIADLGSYIKSDGTEGAVGQITGGMADIDLADNPFYRSFADPIPLTEQAQTLPDMQGSGAVRDLREAASLSPALGDTLADYAATDTRAGQMAQIDAVINQWAATTDFQTGIEKAAAQGDRLVYLVPGLSLYEATGTTGPDTLKAQQIHITETIALLEKFNGQTFADIAPEGVSTGAHLFAVDGEQCQQQAANDAVFEVRRVG